MVSSPDGALMLDLQGLLQVGKKGLLIAFDQMGAKMWALAARGFTDAAIIDEILQEYAIDRETAKRDLENIIQDAERMGLYRDAQIMPPEPWVNLPQTLPHFPWYGNDLSAPLYESKYRPTRWMVFCAWLVMGLFERVLAKISPQMMCTAVQRWPVLRRAQAADVGTLLGKVCAAVQNACVWYGAQPKTCLPRSAATAVMLRLWGVAGKMVIAMRVMPVSPHSYVRVGGSVVNDYPKVKTFYQTVVSF